MSDIYRRCGCRDENGKQWGALPHKPTALQAERACPKLVEDAKHGAWGFYLAAGIDPRTGKRRQIRQAGFTTKQAAQKARNAVAAKLDRGNYLAPTKQTYGDYLQEWLPRHTSTGRGLKETTRFNYERYIRLDIVPSALGRMPLSAVRRFHIGCFIDDLVADGRGVATIRRIVAVVQASFKSAYMDQLVSDNPAVGVRQPRLVKTEPEVWSPAQVGVFLDAAAKHRLSALFEVAMFTGLRRGELLGLHWSDINLTNRTITVRTNRTQVGAHVVESTPKAKAGARTIEIADATSGALIAWKLAQQAEQAAWGDCGTIRATCSPMKTAGRCCLSTHRACSTS
jgi:integrase